MCVSVACVCSLHVFPLRLPHFNEFLLYVNLFSFKFFRQMASRRAQKCNYAFIKEINCKQCQTKKERERDSHASCECALLKIRQIWSKSKLWPKLATRAAAAAENQQAGFVLVSVTVFVSVSLCCTLPWWQPLCLLCVVSRTLPRLLS